MLRDVTQNNKNKTGNYTRTQKLPHKQPASTLVCNKDQANTPQLHSYAKTNKQSTRHLHSCAPPPKNKKRRRCNIYIYMYMCIYLFI